MTAYKDEKRGTWFANFRYKDWRGESKQKSKRGFRTKREAQIWEQDFKKRMSRAASMEFSLACDVYLTDNAPRVRDTTLEQKRYYIERVLKPYFNDMLIGEIDAKAIIDWETTCWRAEPDAARPTPPPISTPSAASSLQS